MLRRKEGDELHILSRSKQVDRRRALAVPASVIRYEPDSFVLENGRQSVSELVCAEPDMNLRIEGNRSDGDGKRTECCAKLSHLVLHCGGGYRARAICIVNGSAGPACVQPLSVAKIRPVTGTR